MEAPMGSTAANAIILDEDLGGNDPAAEVEQPQALGPIVSQQTFSRFLSLAGDVQVII